MSVFLTSMIRRADKMLHCLQPVQVREIRARVCGSQTAFARGAETERDERAARLSSKRASGWDTDMSSGSD